MKELAILFFVPFLGTALGSAAVFFFPNGLGSRTEKVILGFASGVMVAASVWSLLLPAIESSSYYTAAIGFLLGVAFLLLLDFITPHLHPNANEPEGPKTKASKSLLLILSVPLHNVPEGMAVGASAAAAMSAGAGVPFASALALSLGIALQNLPEGMVVAMPLLGDGKKKFRAFGLGALSGIVEPIGSIVAFIFVARITALLPILLSFAAGAMFYVVVEELVPEMSEGEHSNLGSMGAAIGFACMMLLDGIFS